jgi:hypothetical protein
MYFEEAEFATAVRGTIRRIRSNIDNFKQLKQVVGNRIQIGDQSISLDDLEQEGENSHQCMDVYFPFTSPQDVMDKARRFYYGLGSYRGKFNAAEDIWYSWPKGETIPPFPEKLKHVKHKAREPGAVIETIEGA